MEKAIAEHPSYVRGADGIGVEPVHDLAVQALDDLDPKQGAEGAGSLEARGDLEAGSGRRGLRARAERSARIKPRRLRERLARPHRVLVLAAAFHPPRERTWVADGREDRAGSRRPALDPVGEARTRRSSTISIQVLAAL
jgi:hypothetical protein